MVPASFHCFLTLFDMDMYSNIVNQLVDFCLIAVIDLW